MEGNKDDEDEHDPLWSWNKFISEEDSSYAKDLSRVANEPMKPVKDGAILVCWGTAAQCHEGLEEA